MTDDCNFRTRQSIGYVKKKKFKKRIRNTVKSKRHICKKKKKKKKSPNNMKFANQMVTEYETAIIRSKYVLGDTTHHESKFMRRKRLCEPLFTYPLEDDVCEFTVTSVLWKIKLVCIKRSIYGSISR